MRSTLMFCLLLLMLTNTLAAESVGMVTGSTTGTYIQFGKDIAAISKKSGVTIIVKSSKGSVDNIRRMSSSENAAFAIVQSDVLGYLSKSNNLKFKSYAKRLRLIYPFYNEEVHLFARKTIKTLSDLQGKTIAVGPKSSGTNMTAWNILKIASIEPAKRLNLSVDEGISRVLKGEVDAAFVVAGKPRKGFSNLFSTPKESVKALLQQVHFVALDDSALLAEYVRSDLKSEDYGIVDATIPTIAVKALLVTYDFSSGHSVYYEKRCRQLAAIGQAIRQNIGKLRQKHHKKWQQVDLEGDMENWAMDQCSHRKLPAPVASSGRGKTIDNDINCALNGTC
ncbi:MAG: TAXI family TRAP transporter solute-binding subunit [Cocleimonas sp.]|nr:TAXI family TRAP transporter solute-binding subunit [Cocleimonas sp.]